MRRTILSVAAGLCAHFGVYLLITAGLLLPLRLGWRSREEIARFYMASLYLPLPIEAGLIGGFIAALISRRRPLATAAAVGGIAFVEALIYWRYSWTAPVRWNFLAGQAAVIPAACVGAAVQRWLATKGLFPELRQSSSGQAVTSASGPAASSAR
jgi:hypothetical protein